MCNKVQVTIPKEIWSNFEVYKKFCWETYGRYLDRLDAKIDIDLQVRLVGSEPSSSKK